MLFLSLFTWRTFIYRKYTYNIVHYFHWKNNFHCHLKYCGESQNYVTWSATKKLLHIPTSRTDRCGKQSAKCNCILDWTKLKKDFHGVNQDELSNPKLKTLIKDRILNKYRKLSEILVISTSAYMLCPFMSFYSSLSSFFLFLSLLFLFCIFSLHYLHYYFLFN